MFKLCASTAQNQVSFMCTTLVCLIAEQALLSKQVLNSPFLPARFLFSAYVVANKQAG